MAMEYKSLIILVISLLTGTIPVLVIEPHSFQLRKSANVSTITLTRLTYTLFFFSCREVVILGLNKSESVYI